MDSRNHRPAIPHALPQGHEWADYRVVRLLASGVAGLTYLAEDRTLGTPVVVRELLPITIATRGDNGSVVPLFAEHAEVLAATVRRFMDESRQIAGVRHPNIARVLRLFLANDTACIVGEHEAGATLAETRDHAGQMDQQGLLDILLPLLDALAAMHRNGLVHGDIRPSRIRVRSDRSPVLIPPTATLTLPVHNRPERTLTVTPGYAAIECYLGDTRPTPATDLYALAAVAYFLITGEKPIDAPRRLVSDPQSSLAKRVESTRFTAGLLQLIDQALTPDPASRPGDAAEFRKALVEAAAPAGKEALVTSTPKIPSSGRPGAGIDLDSSTHTLLQTALAERIGPIASVVLKRAVASASDWTDLKRLLAAHVPDASAQRQFLQQIEAFGPQGKEAQPLVVTRPTEPVPAAAPGMAQENFDPEMLKRVEAELANHLGAIARIVVKRCASRTHDRRELFRMLATEMGDPVLGGKFLAWASTTFAG